MTWSGEGEWIAARWLRRLARRPRRFSFITATTWLTDEVWLGHDTDTLRLRLFGVSIGRMVMCLRPAPPAD